MALWPALSPMTVCRPAGARYRSVHLDRDRKHPKPETARMLGSVYVRIIDGERWIGERLAFLRERLAAQPPEDERRAMEAEIEVLSKERGITVGGLRAGPIVRRLRRRK